MPKSNLPGFKISLKPFAKCFKAVLNLGGKDLDDFKIFQNSLDSPSFCFANYNSPQKVDFSTKNI